MPSTGPNDVGPKMNGAMECDIKATLYDNHIGTQLSKASGC